MDSNCGPLVSEAIGLPTEPQPLPNQIIKEWMEERERERERERVKNLCPSDVPK